MAASLILVAVSSCTKEKWEGLFGRGGSNSIQAVVSSSSIQTKAGLSGAGGRFLGTIPLDGFVGDSLCIAVYEFDNDDLPPELSEESTPQTKGAVVSTSRINQNGQQFTLNAWLESSNRVTSSQLGDGHVYEPSDATDYHFMKNATATYNGSVWTLGCSSPANENWNIWRNNVPTNFWAMYPTSLSSDQGTINMSWPVDDADDDAQKTASFNYALANPRPDFRDAEYQPDLCFAYSCKAWNESTPGNDNKVNIDFNHALSAVYFTTSGVLNSITVEKIGFDNVPSAAHCEMTGNDGTANGNPGAPTISWSNQSTLKNYRQTYQASDFETFEGHEKTLNLNKSSKVFMMIPDSLAKNGTELWAEFKVKDVFVEKSVDISKFTNDAGSTVYVKWKPGKRYLYKLMFKGLNFTFYFDETDHPTATARSYTNTTSSDYKDIPVVSAVVNADNVTVSDVDWYIKEVIQNGVTTPVGAPSFDSSVGGGFSAVKNGNSLRVTADARSVTNCGSHSYWVNSNGRTDNLDWSPADWSSKGVIDLSRYDFENDTTSIDIPMTTANCYVIRHAGTYRIPLVYGNAIVNGVKNEQSYKPSGVSGAYALTDFKNSNNANISSPFIDNHSVFFAENAVVLWQDEADIVHDVSIVNNDGSPSAGKPESTDINNVRYLQFTISQTEICQNNALIAVTNSNDEVLWSWHIWVTNDPGLLKPAIPVKNNANNIYNFFPLPCLGWIEDGVYPARDSIQIVLEQRRNGDVPKNTITLTVHQPDINSGNPNGCYYQFGRKDPMCRKDTPAYNHSDRPFNKGGVGKVSLADAIQHPEVFYNYGSGSPFDWCSNSYYNLWSGGYCGTGLIESSQAGLSKTVYDPSPRGYMMPASNAFTGFTSTGSNTSTSSQFNVVGDFDKGWNFRTGVGDNTIFFPAAGYRYYSNGSRYIVGYYGFYWSAVPSSTLSGRNLYFYSGNVYPLNGNNRSSGFSARPVQE